MKSFQKYRRLLVTTILFTLYWRGINADDDDTSEIYTSSYEDYNAKVSHFFNPVSHFIKSNKDHSGNKKLDKKSNENKIRKEIEPWKSRFETKRNIGFPRINITGQSNVFIPIRQQDMNVVASPPKKFRAGSVSYDTQMKDTSTPQKFVHPVQYYNHIPIRRRYANNDDDEVVKPPRNRLKAVNSVDEVVRPPQKRLKAANTDETNTEEKKTSRYKKISLEPQLPKQELSMDNNKLKPRTSLQFEENTTKPTMSKKTTKKPKMTMQFKTTRPDSEQESKLKRQTQSSSDYTKQPNELQTLNKRALGTIEIKSTKRELSMDNNKIKPRVSLKFEDDNTKLTTSMKTTKKLKMTIQFKTMRPNSEQDPKLKRQTQSSNDYTKKANELQTLNKRASGPLEIKFLGKENFKKTDTTEGTELTATIKLSPIMTKFEETTSMIKDTAPPTNVQATSAPSFTTNTITTEFAGRDRDGTAAMSSVLSISDDHESRSFNKHDREKKESSHKKKKKKTSKGNKILIQRPEMGSKLALRSTKMDIDEDESDQVFWKTTSHRGPSTPKVEILSPYSIEIQLRRLAANYKEHNVANVTVEVIGRTIEYNNIVILKITEIPKDMDFRALDQKFVDEKPEKRIIFIVHGLTVAGMRHLIKDENDLDIIMQYYMKHLDKFDFFIIPVANPDGLAANANSQSAGYWNKNMSPQSSCAGVVLDRNFDIAWNISHGISPCSHLYPGPVAFSEPETRAIRDVMHLNSHRIEAFIHVHASTYKSKIFKGDAVLYPQGYTDMPVDDDKYIDIKGEIEEAMKNASFKVISVSVDTLYNWYGKVSGSSVDYAAGVYGIPYAMEFAMQLYENHQKDALANIWKRIIDIIMTSIWKGQNSQGDAN